jgi:hypothetical protein
VRNISQRFGSILKFILVESPTLEEAARRAARNTSDDLTDMKDFSDLKIQKAFVKGAERVRTTYASLPEADVYRIKQGNPVAMAQEAIRYILSV